MARKVRLEVWLSEEEIATAKQIAEERNADTPDTPFPWTWRSWLNMVAQIEVQLRIDQKADPAPCPVCGQRRH